MTDTVSISRRSGYTAIPNKIMDDRRLTIEARGLLALLMTFDAGWKFRPNHLMDVCGVGRDRFYRMLGELKEHGYVSVVQTKTTTGQFLGTTWEITDDPCPEKPDTAEPESGKSDYIRRTTRKDNNYKTPQPPEGECLTDLFSAKKEDEDQSSVQDSDKFEEIWSVFPKKKNMPGKDLCRKEYLNALKKVSHDDLLRAANAYAAERAGKDPTFHSRLSKWLRDGNYESYLTSVQSFSEGDLTANQESMLSDGICPPSMKQPDGSPNAAARYWLGVYGYRGAAE